MQGTKLLLNMLLEGYINVKKQGDRTFHITCIAGQQSSDTNPSQNLDPESVSLSTYMFQTKQPQVNNRIINSLKDILNFIQIFYYTLGLVSHFYSNYIHCIVLCCIVQ